MMDKLYTLLSEAVETMEAEDIQESPSVYQHLLDAMLLCEEMTDPIYCQKCGSCGETGCCKPVCMYGNKHQRDYSELEEECEKLFSFVKSLETTEAKELIKELGYES